MNDIIYTTDRAGTVLSINQAVKRTFGFDPQEVTGTHYSRWMPKEEFDKLEAVRPDTLQGQRTTNQVVMSDKEGNEHHVEISVSPLVVDGRIEGTQGIIRDITEQKRALEETRKFKTIFDKADYGAAISDCSGNLLYVNEAFAKMHGYEPAELAGHHLSILHSEGQLPLVNRLNDRLMAGGSFVEEEVWHVRKDGTEFPTLMKGTVIRDDCGRALFWAGMAMDITERRLLEQKLRESEQRYRTVVETAGETIAIVDAQGVFQFMNTTAGRRLGGQPADFVGKTMWDLFPKDVADRQAAHVREVIESGRGKSTFSLSNVRGELRWYYTAVEPLRDDAGNVTAGLIVARDIHELRTAQQELETYREKMIRAEHLASLGTLSAMLAHEMTQPLTVIRLSIQNAMKTLEGASPGPTVLDDLKDGLAEISSVTAIVERFRTFARRASNKTVDKVSLSVVAQRVIRLLEESAHKARVALDGDQLDELPPIHTYGKDIEQVFFILAQNAIQAADGSRDHWFRILGARRGGEIHLQFADDCGGIAPQVLAHLFEPFFTTKPPGEGTGLGLCVVQRIVSQVGGHLKVDSRWGEGTTFFLTLPIETK